MRPNCTGKMRGARKPNLTLTFGVRYSLLQPPYETSGTQVAPVPGISQWFRNRYIGMAEGQSTQPLLSFALSGQANGKLADLELGL